MNRLIFMAAGLALLATSGQLQAEGKPRGVVQCSELKWSAAVLAANPDIALACRGVYEKDGILYARARIEISAVRGNTVRFRTLRTDGSRSVQRSVQLGPEWRFEVEGRQYRVGDLVRGQQLDIFLPEDRFALVVPGGDGSRASAIETVNE